MPTPLTRADFRLFLGKSGQGKSTLARFQAAQAPRVVIHDPNGEEAWAGGAVVVYDRAALVAQMRAPRFRICWRGSIGASTPEERVDAFEWANRVTLARGDTLAVWDEVDMFTTHGRLPPHAYRMVNAGRHVGLRVFACARRPYRLPMDLRANAGRIMAFRMEEPSDLAWMRAKMGADAAALPGLAQYVALDWTDSGTVKQRKSPFR